MTLTGLVSLIDMGLATTINRRLAEVRGGQADSGKAKDLVLTVSIYYFAMSGVFGASVAMLADIVCSTWLDLPPSIQDESVLAMQIWGLVLALRWPLNLLSGVLNGLESQVQLNIVTFTFSISRTLLVLLVAYGWDKSIAWYSMIYAVASLAELALLIQMSLRSLPSTGRAAKVNLHEFKDVRAFTAGVAVATLAATAIKYLDKVVVSGAVPVKEFALYQAIFLLSSGLTLISAVVMRAYYPNLTRSKVDRVRFAAEYHAASRLISSCTAPIAGFMFFNAYAILNLWTQSAAMAAQGELLLRILAVAMVVNSVMQAPQYLLWSAGLSKLSAVNNLIAMVAVVPLTIIMVREFGIVGGGLVWLMYNLVYFAIFPQFLHRNVLRGEKRSWYISDVGKPCLRTVGVFGAIWLLPLPAPFNVLVSAIALGGFMWIVARAFLRDEPPT
jgi:O-antigen/teichoic acid export membrane protein